jgi:hypothetical protein
MEDTKLTRRRKKRKEPFLGKAALGPKWVIIVMKVQNELGLWKLGPLAALKQS